jgi:hypothetical protein
LFKTAAKALARPDDEPQPEPRRKSGETGKGFVAAWRAVLRRDGKQSPPERAGIDTGKAFGKGAKAAMQRVVISAEVYAAATDYLSDTIDCMNPNWPVDAGDANEIDDNFIAQQDHHFPQP